jgi:cysteine synthase A
MSISKEQFLLPVLVVTGCSIFYLVQKQQRHRKSDHDDINTAPPPLTAYEQLITDGTPLVPLRHVSKLLGRNIYAKMESLNPGGTGKDRAALSMIRNAEETGQLPLPNADYDLRLHEELLPDNNNPLHSMILQAMQVSRTGGLVVEGTSGSTGIALATLCAARGHACLVVLPDDQAKEKQDILRAIGAVVYEVPTAAISNPNHYVNIARKLAKLARDAPYNVKAVFMDQFENAANYDIHYHMTGPEIYHQLNGRRIDAFCMSSGTGGTIAGVGTYLKERCVFDNKNDSDIRIVLVDPPGSALYHKIEHGVAYAPQQSERTLRKHRYDTLAEGIGLDRVTHNFSLGLDCIDKAIQVTDQEAVDMAHWILRVEGLWIGSSSAMNLVGAVRTARELRPDATVVTMICDGGQRHATRFWNPTFIKEWGLKWPEAGNVPECMEGVI